MRIGLFHGRIQNSVRGGVLATFYYGHQFTVQSRTDLLEKFGPEGSNCISRESIPEFQRKPFATCDFSGADGVRALTLCPPSGSPNVFNCLKCSKLYLIICALSCENPVYEIIKTKSTRNHIKCVFIIEYDTAFI